MSLIGEETRLQRANELLSVIASCGRQFFRRGDRIARLEVDDNGRVWFIDEYNGARVYTHYSGHWKRFTGGGTLRNLVERLRDYIKNDRSLPQMIFGPWPDWDCGGDPWGYGDDMEQVRSAATRLSVY